MAKKYLSPLNLLNLTSDPGTAAEGDFYWNSSTNRLRIYFDGAWADVSSNTAFTNAANTFTTAQTITPATSLTGLTINAAASAKGLIIKANATTPGNLQEWQNSDGTALAYFASNGQLYLTQHTSITQGKGITWNNGDNYITGLSGYHIQFTTYDGTSGQNEAMRIMGGSIASGGARVGIGSTAPGSKLQVNTAATGEVGLIVRGIASQTADLIQAQNSAGSVVFKVSPTGVINAGGATTIGNILNFSDPGIGVETKFNFLRATDSAWLAVNEYASDQTYYEFGMSDNPGSGDYYQWRFDEWTAPGHGWMPLQIGAYITRFIAPSITQYGNIALNPYNTPFATVNAAATSAANYTVSRYAPTNGTSYSLNKDTGTGTGTVTLNTQSYTGTNIRNYWIEIETGATTFKWGIDSSAFGGTIATGVAITGSAQTLDNGLQVTLSTTGHVAGDRWSWQSSPRRTTAIGGSPVTGAMQIIYPSSGLVGSIIRGASGQTASLQEWQNSSSTVLASIDANGQGSFKSTTLTASSSSGSALTLVAAGGQTADLLTTAGGAKIPAAGNYFIAPGIYSTFLMYADSGSATQVALRIKGFASQTASLTEWQNSSGTVLSYISASGNLFAPGIRDAADTGSYINMNAAGAVSILTRSTTNIGLIVKGTASQSASLQEWQDSSGNILTRINANGIVAIGGIPRAMNLSLIPTLQVEGTTASSSYAMIMRNSNDVNYPRFTLAKSRGTAIGGLTTVASGDVLGSIEYQGTDGTNLNIGARIEALVQGTVSAGVVPARLSLYTSSSAGTSTERLRIDSAGLATFYNDVTVTGNLTVNGTTTNINTTNLVVEDKNIILGDVTTPSNTTADGGGITLKGATDKTFNWVNATSSWTSSEPISAPRLLAGTGSLIGESGLTINGTAENDDSQIIIKKPNQSLSSILAWDGQVYYGAHVYYNDATWVHDAPSGNTNNSLMAQIPGTGMQWYASNNSSGSWNVVSGVTLWDSSGVWKATVNTGNTVTAASFIPTSSTVPTNGMYLPSANTLAFSTNSTANRIVIDSSGNVGIGNTPTAGFSLDVKKNITGSVNSYGIISIGQIQSDVTASAIMVATFPTTAATSFNVNNIQHFRASQGTFGVGSSVTTQYGLYIDATLIGATNNYGVFSNIPSASNRWNIYANGTAANYFAGQTTVGSTSLNLGSGSAVQQFGVVNAAAGNVGIVVRGAASQSSNLEEWQNSSGTALGYITATGQVYTPQVFAQYFTNRTNTGSYIDSEVVSNSLSIIQRSTGAVNLIVKAVASQTANLQEWQNNAGTAVATMSAAGAFTAITKSFDIPHPTKENMRLRYGSLEGPENGVYVRGRSKQDYIALPDYWRGLVDEDTITVNITPVGKKQDIYVDSILDNRIYLGGKIKEYFFTVYGERKDVDKLTVEY